MALRALRNWQGRHRDPVNLGLHALGIPATVAGVVLAVAGHWAWGAGLFVAGYALQFIGHALEGNSSGEALLLRRLRGRGRGTTGSEADPK